MNACLGLSPTCRIGGDVQGGFLSPGSLGDGAACDLCEAGWEVKVQRLKEGTGGRLSLNIRNCLRKAGLGWALGCPTPEGGDAAREAGRGWESYWEESIQSWPFPPPA